MPAGRSVLGWRRLKDDALQLLEGAAAEAERGLEALGAELGVVELLAQLVERAALLVGHLIARALDQDDVARPPLRVGDPDVILALARVESLQRQCDRLLSSASLRDPRVEEIGDALFRLIPRHAAG